MTLTLSGISDHMQIHRLQKIIAGIDGPLLRDSDENGSIMNPDRLNVLCHCAFKSSQRPPRLDHSAVHNLEDE